MSKVKFTIEDFRQLNVADNLINLWSYNYLKIHPKSCFICKTYSNFCEMVLKEQWNPDWGNLKFVIKKIKDNDKTFIDISKFSSATRWEIIDILKKKKKN